MNRKEEGEKKQKTEKRRGGKGERRRRGSESLLSPIERFIAELYRLLVYLWCSTSLLFSFPVIQ